jgi:hypothetical protein
VGSSSSSLTDTTSRRRTFLYSRYSLARATLIV